MKRDLNIKPSEITLTNQKLWSTVHRDEDGKVLEWHRNELAIHRYLSPQLGTVNFFLDENFNLVFIQELHPNSIIWGFSENGNSSKATPIQFSKLREERYGLHRMGITLDMLNEIREIHQALIDIVSDIKIYYPQLIS